MTVKTAPLLPHPASPAPAGLQLSASAEVDAAGDLHLHYGLRGPIADLLIPANAPAAARDGLWQHTCCEAFVAAAGSAEYHEFNLAPSTCWAAYRFTAYRERDLAWQPEAAPVIACQTTAQEMQLSARIPAALLPPAGRWQISLTTVIETRTGEKSYWALRHASPQPDFHQRDSFVLELTRP